MAEEEAYHELSAYTLSLRDPEFIHQHVVDAYMAQHADENTKPIGITFALVGLYMHCDLHRTGKEVQREHMSLARVKRPWPKIALPKSRGAITAIDVMATREGTERNRAIDEWCADVWNEYAPVNRETIKRLLGRRA